MPILLSLHLEKIASTWRSIFISLCYFGKEVVPSGLSNFVYNKICSMIKLLIQVESFKFLTALQLLQFCLSVRTDRQRKFTTFYVLPIYCNLYIVIVNSKLKFCSVCCFIQYWLVFFSNVIRSLTFAHGFCKFSFSFISTGMQLRLCQGMLSGIA